MTSADKWRAIQTAVGVTADGDPGPRTAEAVAERLGISWAIRADSEEPDAESSEPPWMIAARREIGEKEIRGARHNPKILQWWSKIRAPFTDDETPWCAGFVGGMLESVGIRSSRSAAARSYMGWGRPLAFPAQGCVVVFWRGTKDGWSGHVGFLAGLSPSGDPWIIGGNQGDKVSLARFSKKRLLGYRWPESSQIPANYPVRRLGPGGIFSTDEA